MKKVYLFDFQNLWKRSFYIGMSQTDDPFGYFPIYIGIKTFISSIKDFKRGDVIFFVNDTGRKKSTVLERYKKKIEKLSLDNLGTYII